MARKVDKSFLIIVLVLVLVGFFIFTSASLGLLAREGARFGAVAFNQVFFGLFLGFLGMYAASRIDYHFWKKYSFYIFLASIFVTLLVFIPQFGFSSGGATRWIALGPISFQPAEFLKLGFVIYFASWIAGMKTKIHHFKYGLLPLLVMFAIIGAILMKQPDSGTLLVIAGTGLLMFFSAGGRFRDILIVGLIGSMTLLVFGLSKPYILDRLTTFVNPDTNPLGSGYQIQQSLIAIGSGKIFGRGFGQSVQKFDYLPEPIGDSIFAVAAEEWGFIGSFIIVALFVFLALRGLRIAARAPDIFSSVLAVGLVSLITIQSFINIASMLGIFPLTGMPLLFISHGGTALFFALIEMGIVLNISRTVRI